MYWLTYFIVQLSAYAYKLIETETSATAAAIDSSVEFKRSSRERVADTYA